MAAHPHPGHGAAQARHGQRRHSRRAAILMTFPKFSDIGTTVFALAGVLSVVAGLAAQTSLGAGLLRTQSP